MAPQAIQLQEVIVKSPPIRTNSDTTTYRVKAFLDGTERHVEDLLRKLPGVQVAENGKITAFGKSIDKVMIEGEDLFSKNYQIITKSLSAQALDKVEVIDHYSDNPLLRGIEKNNKIVLNLGVRPDLKIRPFGNAGGTLGYKNRYSANAVGLTLLGKIKAGIVGNLNNIGENPVEATEYELTEEDDLKALGSSKSNLLASIPLTMVQLPDLESRRVTYNKAALVGGTATYTINKSLKIKGFSYYYNDQLRLLSGNKTQYFFDNQQVNFQDSSTQTRLPSLWANQFRLEYTFNPKANLRYTYNHKSSDINNRGFLDTQNTQLSEQVLTTGKDRIRASNHHLTFVRKLNNKNALIGDFLFTHNNLARQTLTQSQRYASFFGVDTSFKLFRQNIHQPQLEWKNTVIWKSVNRLGSLSAGLGFLYTQDNPSSNAFLTNQQEEIATKSGFDNNMKFRNIIGLIDIKETVNWKKMSFSFGGTLQTTQTSLSNRFLPSQNFKENKVLFQPTIGVSARIGEYQRLLFFYYNQQSLPSSELFMNGYIQTNYRSFTSNISSLFVTQNNSFQLTYNNTNWAQLYAINVGISYQQNYFVTTSDFSFTDRLNFTVHQPVATKLGQWTANWQLDRLISTLSTKIRLEGYASQSELLNRVNGSNLLPNYSQTFNGKIYAISAFEIPFNFQLSVRLQTNRVLNRSDKTQLSQTTLFVPNITLRYQALKALSLKLIGEQLNWYNKTSKNITQLLDLEAIYHPQKSRWTWTARGNNLLNTNAIYYTFINNYAIFQNSYQLQPRWLTISASYSF